MHARRQPVYGDAIVQPTLCYSGASSHKTHPSRHFGTNRTALVAAAVTRWVFNPFHQDGIAEPAAPHVAARLRRVAIRQQTFRYPLP